jgi:hypothetical protein
MRLFEKVFMQNLMKKIVFTLFFTSYYSNAIPPQFALEPTITISAPTLILPVPNHAIANSSFIHLTLNNIDLNAHISILNNWPSSSKDKYVRLLRLEIDHNLPLSGQLNLFWSNAKKAIESNMAPKTNMIHLLTVNHDSSTAVNGDINGEFSLVYPSLNWLTRSVLLHPEQEQTNSSWYTEPQKKYARYLTNQALLTKKGYPASKASQWLYDRPQAIFQLYLMSGEKQWLAKANELADFYIKNIDEDGIFRLRNRFDPKLLMPKGVLYRYLLSGDDAAKQALKKMFERSLDWDESYSLGRGFWTERNQAAALNMAVSYWELTNDETALGRINDIIDATVAMTFNPSNDWPLIGCPQHSFKSHEGWGDDTPACSPWMMALLGDALWRFYQLTGDVRAASLIDAFGDFILNYGIYYGNARVNNIVIPKYIVSIKNPEQEKLNPWTDLQHTCDVGALLGKSAYIKKKNNQDNFLVKTLFNALLEQCSGNYTRLKKAQNSNRERNYWVLKPPRRFGWMYSTTSDLAWLKSLLLNDY